MWRLIALLILLAIIACVLAWLVTGKVRYRRWALNLGKLGLATVLLFFGLLMIERLAS
jgi:membrane protein YdbS with pleckstrin-like domain